MKKDWYLLHKISGEKNRTLAMAMVITSVLLSVFILLQMSFLSKILTFPFRGDRSPDEFRNILALFLLFSLIRLGILFGQQFFLSRLITEIRTNLHSRLINKINAIGPVGLSRWRSGEITNLFLDGLKKIDLFLGDYLPQLIISTVIPLFILLFVLPLDWISFLVFLLTAPLIPLFMILIGKQAKKATEKQWIILQRMTSYFLDTLRALPTLKMFLAWDERLRHISRLSDEFRHRTMQILRIAFLSALVLEILATISTAIIAVEVGLRLLYSKMTFEQAMFVLLLAPEFYLPLRQLGARFHSGMEGKEAIMAILQFLLAPEYIPNLSESKSPLPPSFSRISFQGIGYRYEGSPDFLLKNLEVVLGRNDFIALTGPSGSGKSTFLALLMGWITPKEGKIFIDDVPLEEISRQEWWRCISYMPQHPYIFHRSLRFNLTLGNDQIPDEQLVEMMKKTRLDSLLGKRRSQLDFVVGEGGVFLSGGEKQRIALTRALLKPASILILDEPTAQMDPELEQAILNELQAISREKLVLIVSHRLAVLQRVNRLLIMENGKMQELKKETEGTGQTAKIREFLQKGIIRI